MPEVPKSSSISNPIKLGINIEKPLETLSVPYLFLYIDISKSISFLKEEYFEHKEGVSFLSFKSLIVPYSLDNRNKI